MDIEDIDEFTSFGATVCKEGGGMRVLKNRLSKARGAFVRLKRTCSSNKKSRSTKLRLYKMLVLPILLYGSWKMKKVDNKEVDVPHNTCLCVFKFIGKTMSVLKSY